MTSSIAPDPQLALAPILDRTEHKYAATVQAVRGYLISLSKHVRIAGVVTSDDACDYLDSHGITADKRLIGAVFRQGFVMCGYARSRRRRGMHATWRAVP